MDQEFVRRGLVDYDELLDSGKLTQKSVESLRRCVQRCGLFTHFTRATVEGACQSPGTHPAGRCMTASQCVPALQQVQLQAQL